MGFPVHPLMVGETDGICGAVVLARALRVALQARPLLATEEAISPFVAAAVEAAPMGHVMGLGPAPEAVRIVACPPGPEAGGECSAALLQRRPAAVLAVEKAGVNCAGVPHSSGGMDIGVATARFEELLRGAQRAGILTIGIGDQGNELGLGAIAEAAAAEARYGRTCRCPCGQGTVSAVPADVTVIGGTSDWGAFGVAAALAFLLDRRDALPSGEMVRSVIAAAVEAGAIDAVARKGLPQVDGYPADFCARLADMLADVIVTPGRFAEMEPERFSAGLGRLKARAPSPP